MQKRPDCADCFCLVTGDGCPQKNSDAAQDCEAGATLSSPVIAAFKGNCNCICDYISTHMAAVFCSEYTCIHANLSFCFEVFQQELDTKHDKYERLVKISRDVTIESKRSIFLLHRVTRYVRNPQ